MMKVLFVGVVVAATLYLGAEWIDGFIERGRSSVDASVGGPVRGLAHDIGETRGTVERANQRIADGAAMAASVASPPASGASLSTHAAAVRQELERLSSR